MLIGVDMLHKDHVGSYVPEHWVMYNGGLEIKDGNAKFKVFSWGNKDFREVEINEFYFNKNFYGYIKAKW